MLRIFQTLPSTNDYCLDYAKQHPGERLACLAEHQTQGRGRHGKTWVSDQPANLYLSYLRPIQQTGPLSLLTGIVLAQVLESLGLTDVQLKWPNDVIVAGAKIAGILIEGPVIGIGLNLVMPMASLSQPATALSEHGLNVDKITLAQNILDRLEAAIVRFETVGFKPFLTDWERFDCLAGRLITWQNGALTGQSIALGINENGGLLLADEPFVLYSGSITF